MKESEKQSVIRLGTATVAAMAGAIAANHNLTEAAGFIAILGAVAPDLAVHGTAMGKARLARILPSFFEGACRGAERTPEAVVSNSDEAEALYEAYRRLVNTAEPFAAEALGRMAGIYIREGLRVDQFFRATGRLIEELGQDEYDALWSIISAAGTVRDNYYQRTTVNTIQLSLQAPLTSRSTHRGNDGLIYYKRDDQWHPLANSQDGEVAVGATGHRIFFLLRSHGLASDVRGVASWGEASPSEFVEIDTEVVAPKLREIIVDAAVSKVDA